MTMLRSVFQSRGQFARKLLVTSKRCSSTKDVLDVTIVGGGPVACLMALELRNRNVNVSLFEKRPDPRIVPDLGGYGFNLTLTTRGLSSLTPEVRDTLHSIGVPLSQRIIHNVDGTITLQPYSADPNHYMLSIPRDKLHTTLLSEAERKGAVFHFNHECIKVDTDKASARFVDKKDNLIDTKGDMLIGSDGANSFVRFEMSRRHQGTVDIQQQYTTYGHIETTLRAMTAPPLIGDKDSDLKERHSQAQRGVHLWPRGEFLLLSLENMDGTQTATLFAPLSVYANNFDTLENSTAFCAKYFPDIFPQNPGMATDFLGKTSPMKLRIVKTSQYHQGSTVLLGDSAHAMVPFYAQGINCCFEDVKSFLQLFDANSAKFSGTTAAADQEQQLKTRKDLVRSTVSSFTAARKGPGDAITELSLSNLVNISSNVAKVDFHARSKLEVELHRRHPDLFIPLYQMVAFTDIPYDRVIKLHTAHKDTLDALCERFDVNTQQDDIINAFVSGPNASSTLNLSNKDLTALLASTSARLVSFLNSVKEKKVPPVYFSNPLDVYQYKDGLAAAAKLRELEPPQEGTDVESLLNTVFQDALPHGVMHHHPGAMAHVPSGGLVQGAVGEFITRSLNRFAGAWMDNPGFVQLETNVIHWFCSMMGYGERSFGYLTSGGSMSNLMGVVAAFHAHKTKTAANTHDGSTAKAVLYAANQSHFSTIRAARTAGIAVNNIRSVPVRDDLSMDVTALTAMIAADKAAGLQPFCVMATAGTTNTGAIDDFKSLAAVCKEHGTWFHVDACFGGFFHITQRGKTFLDGINLADSIAVDAHKSLFLPHGISALLVKERHTLKDTFQISASYLSGFSSDDLHNDFMQWGPELTREVRGLGVWLPLKMHGLKAFQAALDHTLDLMEGVVAQLGAIPGIAVVQPHKVALPVTNFKVLADSDAVSAAKTARLCELINSYGHVYLGTTELPGDGLVLRVCILHHLTSVVTVNALINDIRRGLEELKMKE